MATLTVQQIDTAGVAISTSSAAGGGDKVPPGPTTFLQVTNGGGSSITVTIDSVRPSDYGTDVNGGGSLAAGATKLYGPFPEYRWAGTDGLVAVTYSAVTSVTVAAVKI